MKHMTDILNVEEEKWEIQTVSHQSLISQTRLRPCGPEGSEVILFQVNCKMAMKLACVFALILNLCCSSAAQSCKSL